MMATDPSITLRAMGPGDWSEIADLIYVSTNTWYETHGSTPAFTGGPESTRLFCEVYEDLDPNCCVVAAHSMTGRIMGSCFYHPRETHFSLGIMNVHPAYAGTGIARILLNFIIDKAQAENKPIRLVSSAMNLDSFSLYTRAGFVPRAAFQDMIIEVPRAGLRQDRGEVSRVRAAVLDDVPAIKALELSVSHISREKDYRYFVENKAGIWQALVYEEKDGGLGGFLASVHHPGSRMLGPGFAHSETAAQALIEAQLQFFRGEMPVFLVPVASTKLVARMYALGARNCEVHFCQVLGNFQPFTGVVMPTFMPETG